MGASWLGDKTTVQTNVNTSTHTCKISWSGSKALCRQVSTLFAADVFNEFRTHLNLTREPKGSNTVPKSMACAFIPDVVQWLRSVSRAKLENGGFCKQCQRGLSEVGGCPVLRHAIQQTTLWRHKKGDSQAQRAAVQQVTSTVRPERWTTVSLYLNELLD